MDNNNFTNKVLNDEYTALSTYRGKCNFDTLFRNPVPFKPKPTDEDYALGRITRFFVKKNTSSNFPIYEVDITQYEEFVKNSLYKNTYLIWWKTYVWYFPLSPNIWISIRRFNL